MRFFSQAHLDARIAALATRQHGVIGLAQLVALGLEPRSVQQRAAVGRLHRIHCAVYSLVPRHLLSREGLYMAAVLACGPGAVLSHRSAAHLHELRRDASTKIDVTVPSRSHRRHEGIRLHRSLTLIPEDTTTVNGIPCTTVARTILDNAEVLNRRGLERMLDQAEILEIFDLWALQEQLQRNFSRRCARRLRRALDEHVAGATPTWSELEERFLALVRAAALPEPEVNVFIVLDDGEPAMRVDFVWRDRRLAVETDGHETHRTRLAFEQDRRRDQRLIVAGWRAVRITWRQLTRAPAQVKQTLRQLLAS